MSSMMDKVKQDAVDISVVQTTVDLDFGDYCTIEQKRYGAPNEHYQYKVVGRSISNQFRPVPADSGQFALKSVSGDLCPVVKVICCGLVEEKVETFRLQDVNPVPRRTKLPPR